MRRDTNISLFSLNTFHIEAKAKFFAQVFSVFDLLSLTSTQERNQYPIYVLGTGSNTLFTDDFPGIILKMNILGKDITQHDLQTVTVRVGAGENRHDFVRRTVDNNR